MATPATNAFVVGQHDVGALAVSDGLLRVLDGREVAGVLAHEVSHLRNGDPSIMSRQVGRRVEDRWLAWSWRQQPAGVRLAAITPLVEASVPEAVNLQLGRPAVSLHAPSTHREIATTRGRFNGWVARSGREGRTACVTSSP